jgi:ribosomal protein S18 acetylase RimI-like enzyme
MKFRVIIAADVPELFKVRVATRENALSLAQLADLGITEDSVRLMLQKTHRGWLCEIEGRIAGFAIGNGDTGEMWVIAVLPEFEGMGIGSKLLGLVEEWLFYFGWDEIWLTTDMDTTLRAFGFYLKHGWTDSGVKNGNKYMTRKKPRRI